MRPCEMYTKITNARDDITEALRGVGQNEKNMIMIYYILHIEREYGGQ